MRSSTLRAGTEDLRCCAILTAAFLLDGDYTFPIRNSMAGLPQLGRLARLDSPSLSKWQHTKTRQTLSRVGASMVGRLSETGWKFRAQTGIGDSRARTRNDFRRGKRNGLPRSISVRSIRKAAAFGNNNVRVVRRTLLLSECTTDTGSDPLMTTLPLDNQPSPLTCFWFATSLRCLDATTSELRARQDGFRLRLGGMQSPPT